MKAIVEIEFEDIPVEKIHQTLIDILYILKVNGISKDGKFEIQTQNGVITEKCILKKDKLVA